MLSPVISNRLLGNTTMIFPSSLWTYLFLHFQDKVVLNLFLIQGVCDFGWEKKSHILIFTTSSQNYEWG